MLSLVGLAAIVACSGDSPSPPGNRGLLDVKASPREDIADAARIDTIIATVDPAFTAANTVTFTAPLGTFVNGTATTTVAPDSTGVARAFLRAPGDSGLIVVTATAAGGSDTASVHYLLATPDGITVVATPEVIFGAPMSTTDIAASVTRARGAVSPGGKMAFAIVGGPDALRAGAHLSIDSVRANSGTTHLTLNTTEVGDLIVRATYTGGGVTLVRDVTVHVIKKPETTQ